MWYSFYFLSIFLGHCLLFTWEAGLTFNKQRQTMRYTGSWWLAFETMRYTEVDDWPLKPWDTWKLMIGLWNHEIHGKLMIGLWNHDMREADDWPLKCFQAIIFILCSHGTWFTFICSLQIPNFGQSLAEWHRRPLNSVWLGVKWEVGEESQTTSQLKSNTYFFN